MKMSLNRKRVAPFAAAAFAAAIMQTHAIENSDAQQNDLNDLGKPSFVQGKLGKVRDGDTLTALKATLKAQAAYGAKGNENFSVKRQWSDAVGKKHTHVTQTIDGLKVYGADLIVHENVLSNSSKAGGSKGSSEIYAISGVLATNSSSDALYLKNNAKASAATEQRALASAKMIGDVIGKPERAYVYLPTTGETKLAWKVDVKYTNDHGFQHDIVFFDVYSMAELTRHPQVFAAKVYNTYTMSNYAYNSGRAPGTLLCSTGQTCSDASAQRAHSGASTVYDYYKTKFNRDSINNSGMTMTSSVHTGSNWNNAVWYQNQMFYGDGDGSTFTDFTLDFDIIGHELTHGVTQFTAGLVYQNESGALNESMSDIMGISAEAYKNGASVPNWALGGGAYTPGTSGDALRYMNNPTQDGSSKDYYPERYTGTQDNGGVHWNSGISNLAYVLLVQGGKHPRNKTTVTVPGIGLTKAEQIFYRALTTYMTSSTTFSAARTATANAAQDLYGATEKTAVETAWCAVGVGSCPGTGGGGGSYSASNISASTGNWNYYTITVPSGMTQLKVVISGGTGDADLYVRQGSSNPTTSAYTCRPYLSGNNETCTLSNPTAGTWKIGIRAYSTYSGVALNATWNP